jgi:hypothetical protein
LLFFLSLCFLFILWFSFVFVVYLCCAPQTRKNIVNDIGLRWSRGMCVGSFGTKFSLLIIMVLC